MKNRRLQKVILDSKDALQTMVEVGESTAMDRKTKWWQQFKYEVSLL